MVLIFIDQPMTTAVPQIDDVDNSMRPMLIFIDPPMTTTMPHIDDFDRLMRSMLTFIDPSMTAAKTQIHDFDTRCWSCWDNFVNNSCVLRCRKSHMRFSFGTAFEMQSLALVV